VIDEIIFKEKYMNIRITTIKDVLLMMENGRNYRNHPQENLVKFIIHHYEQARQSLQLSSIDFINM
jgi:hypothetical protein